MSKNEFHTEEQVNDSVVIGETSKEWKNADIEKLSKEEMEIGGAGGKVEFVWKNGGGLHGANLNKTISFTVSGTNLRIMKTAISRRTNRFLQLDKVWQSGNKIYVRISRDNARRRGWLDFYVYAQTNSMKYQFLIENWCD